MAFVIPTIFTAIDKLTAPVMRMQSAMVGMTTIAGEKGAALQLSLQKTSAAAMQVAASSAMIGAAIIIPLGLATKAAMDFEKQMTNVATLVDTTKENMGAMGDAVLRIASRVPVAISDLTESLYQIRSAGVPAAEAMHVLETSAKLSVAGLSSATEATKAVTSAMNSFRQQGITADQIANSFFLTVKEGKTKMDAINESFGNNAPLVAAAGVKLQEFNAITAALTNSGMQASEAQNGIKMAVLGLLNPTKEMAKVFKTLGVQTGEQLIQQMGGLSGALDAVKVSAQKLNIVHTRDLFNRTALTAYTLATGNLNAQIKSNIAEQMAGADALTTAYQKQLGTTASQAQLAKNNLVTLGIRIGELLLPALTALTKVFSKIITPITDFAKSHSTLTKIIVTSIAVFGLFALAVAAMSFTIGTVTKAIWLWNIGLKAVGFTQGIVATLTGRLNGELLLMPGAAKGAAAGIGIMNISAQALLATFTKLAAYAVIIYGVMKLFEKRDEAKTKMETILPHLPAGIDPQKFSDQFQDALNPGHISLMNRFRGVKSYYPQATYDTLVHKYYDEPKHIEDSLSKLPQGMQADAMKNNGSVDSNITITIDNKTGNQINLSSTGAKLPKITQTGTYNN